jgi:hypothetical protein
MKCSKPDFNWWQSPLYDSHINSQLFVTSDTKASRWGTLKINDKYEWVCTSTIAKIDKDVTSYSSGLIRVRRENTENYISGNYMMTARLSIILPRESIMSYLLCQSGTQHCL